MSPLAQRIREQARQLDETERRELGIELFDSAVTSDVETAWKQEAQKRLAEVESNAVVPLEDDEAQRLIDADE